MAPSHYLTNAGLFSTGPSTTNLSDIFNKIQNFSFMKMHLKILFAKWQTLFKGGDEFTCSSIWYSGALDFETKIHITSKCGVYSVHVNLFVLTNQVDILLQMPLSYLIPTSIELVLISNCPMNAAPSDTIPAQVTDYWSPGDPHYCYLACWSSPWLTETSYMDPQQPL